MKKFLYLLLALPVLGLLAACDDDNDLPQATVQLTYEGAVDVDGVLYIVQGEPFSITSVYAVPAQGTGNALVGRVNYSLDYEYIGTSDVMPYGITFDTEFMPLGNHLLQLSGTLAQEDKALATFNLYYKLKRVASAEEIPGYGDNTTEGGTVVNTVNPAD